MEWKINHCGSVIADFICSIATLTMDAANPYESFGTLSRSGSESRARRSAFRWVTTGSLLAAVVPESFTAYELHREFTYAASLPPGTAACGMDALVALMIMFMGGPFCGMIGGTIG